MTDSITITRIATLHPALRVKALKDILAVQDTIVPDVWRVSNALRSFDEQAADYAKGRTAPGPEITWAQAGYSYHQYGLAVDMALISAGQAIWSQEHPNWEKGIAMMKAAGWTWGGDFPTGKKDNDHFEYSFGYSITQLLALYNSGNTFTDSGNVYVTLAAC